MANHKGGCLIGTMANARGCNINQLGVVQPNADRPAERWFLAIRPGDTPANSQVSAITVGWVEEWQAKQPAPVVNVEGGRHELPR